MVYAASKDALRKSLVGISTEIQGTDFDEVSETSGEFESRSAFVLEYKGCWWGYEVSESWERGPGDGEEEGRGRDGMGSPASTERELAAREERRRGGMFGRL